MSKGKGVFIFIILVIIGLGIVLGFGVFKLRTATSEKTQRGEIIDVHSQKQEPEQDSEKVSEEVSEKTPVHQNDWVAELKLAEEHSQIIVVAAEGNEATVSFHERDEAGYWSEVLSARGYVGKNGIGKTKEGDRKSPTGAFGFTHAFGVQEDPGCGLDYLKVDNSYYWVDDSGSEYYNQFVTTKEVTCDWNSAEHITEVGAAYNYVLALDYNKECSPGLGSAIFLHCETGRPTAGCVSVPEETMKSIVKKVKKDCVIIIDSESGVKNY